MMKRPPKTRIIDIRQEKIRLLLDDIESSFEDWPTEMLEFFHSLISTEQPVSQFRHKPYTLKLARFGKGNQ